MPPANEGDLGLIPGLERYPGGENDNPLQYSCLENPINRGAWWATVHGVTESQTWLRDSMQSTESVWKWYRVYDSIYISLKKTEVILKYESEIIDRLGQGWG